MEISSPPQSIVGVEQRFVFQQPITLYIDEKRSFSGDDFTINDSNGVAFFKCKGKAFSFSDKKVIYDNYDKPILNIQEEVFMGHKMKIYAGDDSKNKLGELSRGSMLKNNKFIYTFTNLANNRTEELDLKCDLIGISCGIFYGKEKEQAPLVCNIAKIRQGLFSNKKRDHYCIKVAPGVDAALMVALTICFDELKSEKEEKK